MEAFGSASSRGSPPAAWCRAMAMVLALATIVAAVVDAGKGDAAAHNVTLICQSTPYPDACETALASRVARSAGDPFVGSMQFTISQATSALAQARSLSASPVGTVPQQSGLHDCAMLLDMTVHQLRDALAGSVSDPEGATTWLSSALTNQDTCNDSLAGVPASAGRNALRRQVGALARFVSTALALHVGNVKGRWSGVAVAPAPAPELGTTTAFPPWVSEHDRRLLLSRASDIKPDAVVAQDGSGTHRTIGEAITAVADRAGRKVIYVKSGRYEERVTITYKQENVMLVGDGKGRTIVDSKNSVAGGYDTISTATVAAMGTGFIARGMSILNSAGPDKGQAVALLVAADRSVVYQCEIKANQDTLYTQSGRQFYADDDISGTVDFIFGNSAAVFQGCNIQAQAPVPGQEDVITAQGRTDQNQNTGFSIHRCRITGAPNLGKTPVYLGRPWRKYSRVVVMKSYMDGSVSPAGWLAWPGSDPSVLSTLYYGEYGNSGSGAWTNGRVMWKGVHTSMSAAEAMEFTVAKLIIAEDSWLGSTGVPYISGL